MATSVEWDDVWDEYDARSPAPAPVAPLPPRASYQAPKPAPAKRRRAKRRAGWLFLSLGILAMAAVWVSIPYATAWQLAQAMDSRNPAEIAMHVDTASVQAELRDALDEAVGPMQTAQAAAFLGAMATEMTAAWAQPGALAEVAQARGVPRGAVSEALRRTIPIGLGSFDLALRGTMAPMVLRLALRHDGAMPRWQVTGVRLDDPTPIAPGMAPMRLSSLR